MAVEVNKIGADMTAKTRLSRQEIARRGEELYAHRIRPLVDTADNHGKIIVIDVETGEYEIAENGLDASHRLLARRPDAPLLGLRIGLDAVEGFGGSSPQPVKR